MKSRGLGDVYKRQSMAKAAAVFNAPATKAVRTVVALQDKKEAEA